MNQIVTYMGEKNARTTRHQLSKKDGRDNNNRKGGEEKEKYGGWVFLRVLGRTVGNRPIRG